MDISGLINGGVHYLWFFEIVLTNVAIDYVLKHCWLSDFVLRYSMFRIIHIHLFIGTVILRVIFRLLNNQFFPAYIICRLYPFLNPFLFKLQLQLVNQMYGQIKVAAFILRHSY